MPLLSYDKPAKRLSSNDAFYVESIQTNGGTLGYTKPIGRAAFYPNGGKSQPGCGIDLTGGCSHTRAVTYYVESLRMNNFPSMRCASYEYAINKDCGSTYSSVRMGSLQNEFIAVGEFYVPVNKESPFGLGDTNENYPTTTTTTTPGCNTSPDPTTVTPTTSTPAEEITPTTTAKPNKPEDDKGKGHSTNIYILNLIFVNSHVNKPEST
ncbi:hypothetical protein ACLKA7_009446 [Drosophila subpalustris]